MQLPAGLPPVYGIGMRRRSEAEIENRGVWTYVAQISVGGVDLWTVVLVERHAPEAIVLDFSCNVELTPQLIRALHDRYKRTEKISK